MAAEMILSVFPGIDLLGRAFEESGFCVVRGPDPLWGGDIHTFHPPAGIFNGVIGGPPCQAFSSFRHKNGSKAKNLIPEFERVVCEAQPIWFLMENVVDAPLPVVVGYAVHSFIMNNRWVGGEQNRVRRFSFGILAEQSIDLTTLIEWSVFENPTFGYCVCASGITNPDMPDNEKSLLKHKGWKQKHLLAEGCRLQGLPEDFLSNAPFTVAGKWRVIGNGVPLPMGRALARAIKLAIDEPPSAAEE